MIDGNINVNLSLDVIDKLIELGYVLYSCDIQNCYPHDESRNSYYKRKLTDILGRNKKDIIDFLVNKITLSEFLK